MEPILRLRLTRNRDSSALTQERGKLASERKQSTNIVRNKNQLTTTDIIRSNVRPPAVIRKVLDGNIRSHTDFWRTDSGQVNHRRFSGVGTIIGWRLRRFCHFAIKQIVHRVVKELTKALQRLRANNFSNYFLVLAFILVVFRHNHGF